MDRRRFITYAVAAPLTLALPACRRQRAVRVPQDGGSATGGGASSAVVLDALQWQTLDAACARILPTDQDPGAREAAVVRYIDGQLAYPPVNGFRPLITAGLRRLEFIAQRVHRGSFAHLAADRQDAVLQLLQRSKRMAGRFTGQQFFNILVVLTLEGFLSDPVYGGNRERVGWKMIGFVPQAPGPTAPYRGRYV